MAFRIGRLVTLVSLIAIVAVPASAQVASPARPFTVGAIGGFSAGQGHAGGSIGGTVAFDVSDRITAEARGIYGDRGEGRDAVEVSGTMLVTLARSKRTSAYAGVGGGLYRTNFDLGDVRYAVGAGLRYRTPVGPVRFDFGYQLNPIDDLLVNGQPQLRRWRLHFSIGQAF